MEKKTSKSLSKINVNICFIRIFYNIKLRSGMSGSNFLFFKLNYLFFSMTFQPKYKTWRSLVYNTRTHRYGSFKFP